MAKGRDVTPRPRWDYTAFPEDRHDALEESVGGGSRAKQLAAWSAIARMLDRHAGSGNRKESAAAIADLKWVARRQGAGGQGNAARAREQQELEARDPLGKLGVRPLQHRAGLPVAPDPGEAAGTFTE